MPGFASGVWNPYSTATITDEQLVFDWKELLKTAGWALTSSGDGISLYSAVGDILTTGAAGAGGFGNARSWFRVSKLGREFTVQHGGALQLYRVKHSPAAGFVGGSPDFQTTPSATDEAVPFGSGTDAAPGYITWAGNATVNRVIMGADSDPNSLRCYFAGWDGVGSSAPEISVMFDDIVDAPVEDTQPFIYYLGGGSSFSWFSELGLATAIGRCFGYEDEPPIAANFKAFSAAAQYAITPSATVRGFPENLVTNQFNGKWDVAPMAYHGPSGAGTLVNGFKGYGSIGLWTRLPGKRDHGNLDGGTRNWILVNSVWLPWSGEDIAGESTQELFLRSPAAVAVADTTQPTISNFSPAVGVAVAASDSISFDIADNLGAFARIAILVSFPDGTAEVAHDGDAFRGNYLGSPNNRSVIANGFQYTLRRSGNWPATPTVEYLVIDASGNSGVIA